MKYVIYISGELGELSMASITEGGIEFCKNNPWDFERPWTIEDLSEEAKEVFTDEPDEWSEGSEGYFVFADEFSLEIESKDEKTGKLTYQELSPNDLTLAGSTDWGFRKKSNEADVGAEPMMYLMSMERGTWGYYELEIAEKLDPQRLFYSISKSPFGDFLGEICYLSHDNKIIMAESQPETDSGGGSISIAAGWYSPNLDNIFEVEEIFNSILKNN